MFSHLHKPDFEHFQQTLFNRTNDYIPLIELGIHPQMREKIMGRPAVSVKDEIDFMRSLGYDFIKVQPGINIDTQRSVAKNANVAADRSWSSEHDGVVHDWQSFEKYPWVKKADLDYSRLEEAGKTIPDGMGIIGQYGDIYTTVWEMLGFENFSMKIYEDPELITAMFEKIGELVVSMFEAMAGMDFVKVLWYSDDLAYSSGLMVSPDFYRENLFPYMKRIGDLAKARNIPFIFHSDGVLYDIMDDLINDIGITSLHPLEPISMDMAELKERYGDQLCLCGGIDVDQLCRAEPEKIRNMTRDFIEIVREKGGWCAGSSNSIPEYVKPENYLAMIETVLKEGRW
ncbi:MAG: uroporphyrinogen decarboxylase family protein [Candidatus Marinimicrobia bacterium]|nr:uroporphyrinogen decarboxylase family protein [Candidatus Neomarinimicrobiota bacterium]